MCDQDFTLVELVAHMCSIFGNMPPVFRRPAHMIPQYAPTPYTPSTSATSAYTQPQQQQQQQSSYYQQQQAQQSYQSSAFQSSSYGGQSECESLFGPAPSGSRGSSVPVRVEDRSVALKVEVTSKIQLELERMFHRIRGTRALARRPRTHSCGLATVVHTTNPACMCM